MEVPQSFHRHDHNDLQPLPRPHFSKASISPHGTTLGTKLLICGPLRDTQNPNYGKYTFLTLRKRDQKIRLRDLRKNKHILSDVGDILQIVPHFMIKNLIFIDNTQKLYLNFSFSDKNPKAGRNASYQVGKQSPHLFIQKQS